MSATFESSISQYLNLGTSRYSRFTAFAAEVLVIFTR
jgi:hypothetical protein